MTEVTNGSLSVPQWGARGPPGGTVPRGETAIQPGLEGSGRCPEGWAPSQAQKP